MRQHYNFFSTGAQHRRVMILVSLAFVTLVSLSNAHGQNRSSKGCVGFDGKWNTDFGTMTLTQSGSYASGTYELKGTQSISGTVKGNMFTGEWVQSNGKGKAEFKLDPDRNYFAGSWWDKDGVYRGAWNGNCQAGPADDKTSSKGCVGFDGKWNTDFGMMTLTQSGSSVSGTYEHKGTQGISGTVKGDVLIGEWVQSNGKGKIEFRMEPNGDRFQGSWWDAEGVYRGAWNGNCQEKGASETPDISGTWIYGSYIYNITQNSSTFTWYLAAFKENAEGTIKGKSVTANLKNINGSKSVAGTVTQVDSSGRATRIEWSNGVVFTRN